MTEPAVTYGIYSGSERVSESLNQSITDLDMAKDIGRRVSEQTTQRDMTITVRSHKPEFGGEGAWRAIVAVFVNGEEIPPDDARYPHDLNP